MSQTPKYSPEYVETIISELEKRTTELYNLLASEEEYSTKVEKVIEILKTRENYIKEFEDVSKQETLELFFRNNHNKWLNRIKKILELDKKNLDIIEKNMNLQSEKVKDINKQKKLLVYMKGQL
ncbi:MAG: hypothetical protein ACPLX7_03315 [Candidatus Kapaibacteriota bacterium]|jgi:hypothetical protein